MFCIAFHFFSKPPRHSGMTLGKTRSRRDSFGLEVRPDGSLAFDFPREETSAGVVDRHLSGNVAHGVTSGAGIDRQRRGSRTQLYKADLRASIGPLMRRRRRRDSFGLEVREDGTLSFDQLASGVTLDLSRVGSESEDDEGIRSGGGDIGIRDGLTGNRNGSHSRGLQRGRLRRRDSFGLEVRADGTLSLDRLVNPAQEGAENQPSSPPPTSHIQVNANRILASGTTRVSGVIAGPRSSANRGEECRSRDGMGTTLGPREVQVLMERIRRLEGELARRGRPPTRDVMEAPPAYESRSESPVRVQRQENGPLRGVN